MPHLSRCRTSGHLKCCTKAVDAWFGSSLSNSSDNCHTTGPSIRSIRRQGRQLVMHVLLFPLCEESIIVDFCQFCIITYIRGSNGLSVCLTCAFIPVHFLLRSDHTEWPIWHSHTWNRTQFLRSYNNQCHFFFLSMSVLSSVSVA